LSIIVHYIHINFICFNRDTGKILHRELSGKDAVYDAVHMAFCGVDLDKSGNAWYHITEILSDVLRIIGWKSPMTKLEPMDDFFAARVHDYDEHMLMHVEGCREGYPKMAETIPADCKNLLDLGCGTGLELDAIFLRFPGMVVTGIDMTSSMLEKLTEKHPGKALNLICGDYFQTDLGTEQYDCAVSFETMHHFKHEKKISLYQKIHDALKTCGCYIECDYMVGTQLEEDYYFAEYDRLCNEQNLPENVFYHYDTPCTVENQIMLLKKAGFRTVEKIFSMGNTVMLKALK